MIRHVFMMKFKPEVSQEQRLEFAKHMAKDMEQIRGIKNPIVGTALEIEGKPAYNLALYIDFLTTKRGLTRTLIIPYIRQERRGFQMCAVNFWFWTVCISCF